MRAERIVITGDVFRTTDGDANQLYNTRWLHGEVAHHLHALTGLRPEIAFRRNAPDDGRAVIAEWYRLLGHAPSLEAWAATYGSTVPPPDLVEAMRADYDRALVIGFELSPLMQSILGALDMPWVTVEVGPLRFLEDLTLVWRFSWPVRIDHPGLLAPEQVREAVGRLRARHAAWACDFDGACIFLGQTRYDRSLIKDGAFFPDSEAIEGVAASLGGRRLVVKPHPLAPHNPLLALLQARFAASATDANIYRLLASAADLRFLTISSSSAIEARHFGHAPRTLHAATDADADAVTSLWAHRCAAFWRSSLAPVLRTNAAADFEERTVPDRLRRSLGAWGWPPPEGGPHACRSVAPRSP